MTVSLARRKDPVTVRDLLPDDVTVQTLRASDRQAAIGELLNAIVIGGHIDLSREREVLQALLEREKVASTGIGNEFAFPHVKTRHADHLAVAVGFAPQGIDFAARDQRPVKVVLLAVGPTTETQAHLSLLRAFAALARREQGGDPLIALRDRKTLLSYLAEIRLDQLGK